MVDQCGGAVCNLSLGTSPLSGNDINSVILAISNLALKRQGVGVDYPQSPHYVMPIRDHKELWAVVLFWPVLSPLTPAQVLPHIPKAPCREAVRANGVSSGRVRQGQSEHGKT